MLHSSIDILQLHVIFGV